MATVGHRERDSLWAAWYARWERFQEAYVPFREEQFAAMLEYIGTPSKKERLRVLDLCAGPGSAAVRLLARRPDAAVVAVDADPWLIALGRKAAGLGDRVDWIEADVRDPDWTSGLSRMSFDAVLFATALEWFTWEELRNLYGDIARVLHPGGVFLVAGTMPAASSPLAARQRESLDRWRASRLASFSGEDWISFWRAAREEPQFRDLLTRRDVILGRRVGHVAASVRQHEAWLADGRFTDVAEVWRTHAHAILAAIL